MECWKDGEIDAKRGSFRIRAYRFLEKPGFTISRLSDILVL